MKSSILEASKILVAAFLAHSSAPASATLIDDTVGCGTSGFFGSSGGTGLIACDGASAVVVTPDPEFALIWRGGTEWAVNIEAASILLTHTGTGFQWAGENLAVLDLAGLDPNGSGIIRDIDVTFSGIGNFDPDTVTFDDHSVRIDMGGRLATGPVVWNEGSSLQVQLLFQPGQAPEPASLALLGLALAGLGWMRRKV